MRKLVSNVVRFCRDCLEALRDDDLFAYAGAWEFTGVGEAPVLHKEPLVFENVKLAQRSYK